LCLHLTHPCIRLTSLRAESATVEFWVVLGTELYVVLLSSKVRISKVFRYLKDEYADISGKVSYKQCKYYRLKNPVSIPDDVDDADIVEECLNESNLEEVSPSKSLNVLAPELDDRHIYMVIKLPEGAPQAYLLIVDVLIICFRRNT